MQQEINLREVIDIIWKGKQTIILTTLIFIVLSGLISFFVIKPTYEVTSTIRIGYEGSGQDQSVKSFAEVITSDSVIKRVIEKLGLTDQYTIESIKNNMKSEVVSQTNVLKLKVKGEDPSAITRIANLMAFELGSKVEVTDLSQKIVDSRKRIEEVDDLIVISQRELEETSRQLEETPEKLIVRQALADEPFLQSILEDNTGLSSREAGQIQLESEYINPVYTSLKSKVAETTINLEKLIAEKEALQRVISESEARISELERQIFDDKISTSNTERLLNGLNAVFISPAIEPNEPVSPSHLLNLLIGVFLGLFVGGFTVFFRAYWKMSESTIASYDNSN